MGCPRAEWTQVSTEMRLGLGYGPFLPQTPGPASSSSNCFLTLPGCPVDQNRQDLPALKETKHPIKLFYILLHPIWVLFYLIHSRIYTGLYFLVNVQ